MSNHKQIEIKARVNNLNIDVIIPRNVHGYHRSLEPGNRPGVRSLYAEGNDGTWRAFRTPASS